MDSLQAGLLEPGRVPLVPFPWPEALPHPGQGLRALALPHPVQERWCCSALRTEPRVTCLGR